MYGRAKKKAARQIRLQKTSSITRAQTALFLLLCLKCTNFGYAFGKISFSSLLCVSCSILLSESYKWLFFFCINYTRRTFQIACRVGNLSFYHKRIFMFISFELIILIREKLDSKMLRVVIWFFFIMAYWAVLKKSRILYQRRLQSGRLSLVLSSLTNIVRRFLFSSSYF